MTKKIHFFQGSKSELEEMTGQQYEFIDSEEITKYSGMSEAFPKNVAQTFVEARSLGVEIKNLREFMRNNAAAVGADALIHYKEHEARYIGKNGEYDFYREATGTPLKLKRSQ